MPVLVAPEITTDVVVQLMVPPVALAPGAAMSCVTGAVAVLVQPFAVFVIVIVYVPEALTLGLSVVPPETMPGPAQLN